MIKIPFVKMQGAGNDFLVIDHDPSIDYVNLAPKACDRHMGVGADGLLLLDQSRSCDYRMRIINADGSEADMCGNGARCMAVHIASKFALVPETFTMETHAGPIHARVFGETASVQLGDPKDYRPHLEIKVGERKFTCHFINTGVPHVIVFVQGLQEMDVASLGRLIRNHHSFAPKGTNVNFVEKIKDGVIALRTYERGVEDETLACGTGSVAAALVSFLQSADPIGPKDCAQVRVVTKSGEVLEVMFNVAVADDRPVISNVWLKGGGKVICKGEYHYHP